ncbi:MAG TPA: hypothetical protein VK024_02745 [Actinomycetaceae bacterium]|nr:hypothetical protein [Actinomycetaceae bacterium]
MGHTWIRRLTSAAAALLVAMLALATLIVSAAAAVTSANPADGYGELYADFTTDDALFAYVTSDTRGGRVCVIAAEARRHHVHPHRGARPSDGQLPAARRKPVLRR